MRRVMLPLYVPVVSVLGSTETVIWAGVADAEGLTDNHFPPGGALTSAWKRTLSPVTVTLSVWAAGAGAPLSEEKENDMGLAARAIDASTITLSVTTIVSGVPVDA